MPGPAGPRPFYGSYDSQWLGVGAPPLNRDSVPCWKVKRCQKKHPNPGRFPNRKSGSDSSRRTYSRTGSARRRPGQLEAKIGDYQGRSPATVGLASGAGRLVGRPVEGHPSGRRPVALARPASRTTGPGIPSDGLRPTPWPDSRRSRKTRRGVPVVGRLRRRARSNPYKGHLFTGSTARLRPLRRSKPAGLPPVNRAQVSTPTRAGCKPTPAQVQAEIGRIRGYHGRSTQVSPSPGPRRASVDPVTLSR